MDAKQYQREAQATLSHSFFGEFIGTSEMIAALNEAIAACAKVDKLKKLLFYGRGADERLPHPRRPYASIGSIPMTGTQETVFHALIGAGTEGAECFEILRDWLMVARDSKEPVPFPNVKVMEELGGGTWYVAVAAEALGVTIEDIFSLNIAQLRARYKDKFDAFEANNRNLSFETSVMKSVAQAVTPEKVQKDWPSFNEICPPAEKMPKADEEIERFNAQK